MVRPIDRPACPECKRKDAVVLAWYGDDADGWTAWTGWECSRCWCQVKELKKGVDPDG